MVEYTGLQLTPSPVGVLECVGWRGRADASVRRTFMGLPSCDEYQYFVADMAGVQESLALVQ
jgi:hypothetical protein